MPRKFVLALSAALPLAACAAYSDEGYPSLAIGDRGRVSGTFEPAAPQLPDLPATAGVDAASLTALLAEARSAHDAFLGEAQPARARVSAARGAARDSDAWSRAQIAVATLESARSLTMVTLADLDRIMVDADMTGQSTAEIVAAQAQVDALVSEESQLIDQLLAQLR